MKRFSTAAVILAALSLSLAAFVFAADKSDESTLPDGWTTMTVPGLFEELAPKRFGDYDGYVWYRCFVNVPEVWGGLELQLAVSKVDNVSEVYFNGYRIGGRGTFPPNYESGLSPKVDFYKVLRQRVKAGEPNVVAIRIFDHDGRGGFKGAAPALMSGSRVISMAGAWQFRTGDDKSWAKVEEPPQKGTAVFSKVVARETVAGLTNQSGGNAGALTPAEAMERFTIPEDLEIQPVATEPEVRQPVFFNFDERGRMWVVQFLQYPYPAGLKMVSKDKFWRAVYDKVPPAPPNHYVGADKITIHEDTDGDGTYDKHKTFVDGLSIVSACAKGRGGVWVLNPPYLLFYPDRNHDDIPDGDPEVHLQGFGMEDTHSVVNSLRWGPDGWLYAAQGSTVSGNVSRPGSDEKPIYSMGQLIWRYHPELRRYEVFAEGGGNAFGVEFDAKGRCYSGTNGGDARGYHYVQGSYARKSFTKHGPLSNPYAFGYFPAMAHHKVPRFTHNFVIYEADALPKKYHGNLFGIEPLQGQVVQSDIQPDGATFKTNDLDRPVLSEDVQFRPVDIKVGPDGAIYVADMYEPQISHSQHFSGQIDKSNGRIYRLGTSGSTPGALPDLSRHSSRELVEVLRSDNKWLRQTAQRLLYDRRDTSLIPGLRKSIAEGNGQFALECLWAINASGGFTEELAAETLQHEDPFVRMWTVRLLCDDFQVSPVVAGQLAEMAVTEPYVEVRSQLASSAKRLPAEHGLPIARALLTHAEDVTDPHLPLLLWWALESKAADNAEALVGLFEEQTLWSEPIVRQHILERLMRRFAQAGSRNDLIAAARLFELAPDKNSQQALLKGFELAYQGRTLTGLPAELVKALEKVGGGSLSLGVRQGRDEAIAEALAIIADPKAKLAQRQELIQTFGEVNESSSVSVLLKVLGAVKNDSLQSAILTALQRYPNPEVGQRVVGLYGAFSPDVQAVAQTLLSSRSVWARQLLEAVEAGKVAPDAITLDTVRMMTFHRDDRIAELIRKHWSDLEGASNAAMQEQMARVGDIIATGTANPANGKKLFAKNCGKCHLLFGEGGRIGPDLTTYKRDDMSRMLLNVVNPSAEIREGFETYLIITDEGRTNSGFLFDRDNRVVVLRGADGQNVTIARDHIDEMIRQPKSLMPEGLLKDLTDQDVRDLFAYLRSSQPLN